jgi:hypothetical protein
LHHLNYLNYLHHLFLLIMEFTDTASVPLGEETSATTSWFEMLFKFEEKKYDETKSLFIVRDASNGNGNKELISTMDDKTVFPLGNFSTPNLESLRQQGLEVLERRDAQFIQNGEVKPPGSVQLTHLAVEDAFTLHAENPGAVIQAASQFNALEFPSPGCTPEAGVTGYAYDRTQGPACALACGAGTVFRNYFADVDGSGQEGQEHDRQINNLDDFERKIDNSIEKYFEVINGYTLGMSEDNLSRLNAKLTGREDELRDCIKVGVHRDVGVVFKNRWESCVGEDIRCTQVFCSALSLGVYCPVPSKAVEKFAKIILAAAYEATLWTAVLESEKKGDMEQKVFLTFVGGGVFGNRDDWICDAIARAVMTCSKANARLKVVVCYHKEVDKSKKALIQSYMTKYF